MMSWGGLAASRDRSKRNDGSGRNPPPPMGRGEGPLCHIVDLYQHQIEHLLKDLSLQAGPAGTTQLKNPGLFRGLFEGLPTGGNPWNESLAPFALQNRFARGIARINGDEGLSDFFDQHWIQVAVRREAAVTVARAGPDDPEASGGQLTLRLQSLDGPPAHRTGIILAATNPLYDIALIRTSTKPHH